MQIDRFLIGFREQLDPARILHRHAVGMVVPDIDRRTDCPVADGHDDGKAQAGGVVYGLAHEQETLAGRRRVGPGAGGRGADGHRKCGKLYG